MQDTQQHLKNNKPTRHKKRFITYLSLGTIIPLIVSGIIIFFTLDGCSNSVENPFIVVEIDKERFLMHYNEHFLLSDLKNNEDVNLEYAKAEIYFIKNIPHISPNKMRGIAPLLTGEFTIHRINANGIQGYISPLEENSYVTKSERLPNEKIGKSDERNIVTLGSGNEKYVIEWVESQNGRQEAIQNCSIETFWVKSNPYPGKTIWNASSDILIDLNILINNFHPEGKIQYQKEDNVLLLFLPYKTDSLSVKNYN